MDVSLRNIFLFLFGTGEVRSEENLSTRILVLLHSRCQYFSPIFQIFDYAQYYLNLRSANTHDKAQTAADSDFASHGSEAKEAPAAVEAQWRLEYNFTMHYRFRRRRMPGHLGRGIITSSVLEGLERKLANNK